MSKPQVDLSSWLTKAEVAAKFGGCAEKTIDRMAKKGRLQKALRPQPGGSSVAVFHPGDVERELAGRIAVNRKAYVMPAGTAPENTAVATRGEQVSDVSRPPAGGQSELIHLAHLMATITKAREAMPGRWYTLEEAENAYGIPRESLLRMIHTGELPARQFTPIRAKGEKRARAGSSWRMCPADLDALRGVRADGRNQNEAEKAEMAAPGGVMA